MKSKFIFLFSIILHFTASTQDICTGNLGDNIFAIGDFGSGSDVIVLMDPLIAPGYVYITGPPPNDGRYIITNDMTSSAWDAVYGTWIRIQDNSDDPEGYMMVVNASFEPGIFYEEEVTGLCENTLYEFSADVINLIRAGVTGHHEPNISFLLDDIVQYSSGIVDQDESWHKYGFTFTTAPAQTTVRLSLINNAPGGIGNDLALDNISFRPCGPSAFANAEEDFVLCANGLDPIEIFADTEDGAAIQWQFFTEATQTWADIPGATMIFTLHNIFEPGEYRYRYLTAGTSSNLQNDRCRVISDIATVTILPIEFTVYDTICESLSYEFGTQTLTEMGFYEETFLASSGCDSFVDLFLHIVEDPDITLVIDSENPSCFGDDSGSISVLEVNGGEGPYDFFVNNQAFETMISSLSGGAYTITTVDRYLCEGEQIVELNDPEEFIVDLGPDTTVEFGANYEFNITSDHNISTGEWNGAELECIACIGNSTRPFESGLFVFSALDENSCMASDSIYINVKPLEDLFFQPNIFSPNEDGINDRFLIYSGTEAIREVKSFSIYDRYGNLIYKTINQDFKNEDYGWDGTADGDPVVSGVYTYLYQFVLINDTELMVGGDVTLIR